MIGYLTTTKNISQIQKKSNKQANTVNQSNKKSKQVLIKRKRQNERETHQAGEPLWSMPTEITAARIVVVVAAEMKTLAIVYGVCQNIWRNGTVTQP